MRILFLALAFAVAIASVRVTQPENLSKRTLTFAQRVYYQRAIEEVYWRHRIWPKERPDPKPSLDAVMSQAELKNKVADYLHKSQMLEDYWQWPLTSEQLQAEMNRMARTTKQPEMLRELFQALGNDPFVIAECLAKPVLSERLLENSTRAKKPLDSAQAGAEKLITAVSASYTLPVISAAPNGCINDTWTATSTTNAPSARWIHTAVWTGSEMIVWGGSESSNYTNTGGRYNPATDSWTATTTSNAPSARAYHTAVWTGKEMIVWGGDDQSFATTNTGGRYNPVTDSWMATTTTNAPSARYLHTAVWTGSEMIVWGGSESSNWTNTGGRYNPANDSWAATGTTGAPTARVKHTAVWTGSEMIVWGGSDNINGDLFTGGRYNPVSNSWTATNTVNPPSRREAHTAVWTGSEMIVWGGCSGIPCTDILDTGGRYNPNNTWTDTSTVNAPNARYSHTAVWTGSEMIVWGGAGGSRIGGRYNPVTDSWTATSVTNAPSARYLHTAVWTGSEMIVWGGFDGSHLTNTGGRYCAQAGAPSPTPTATGTPPPCSSDTWTATSMTNVPDARYSHTAVWTGSEMIVWGGSGISFGPTGGKYIPSTDSWTATSTVNAPTARGDHTAIWTGSEMIVWGGVDGQLLRLNTGGRYNPATDSWTATSTTNVPDVRAYHTAVWTGTEMIVWGGEGGGIITPPFNTGGRYNPGSDTWTATSTVNAPTGRTEHTAVWTGSEMIVWGGAGNSNSLNTGGRYNPSTDTWTATSVTNAPTPRILHREAWTGTEMIVWGGSLDGSFNHLLNTGGRYIPGTDSWIATSTTNVPDARQYHTAVWTGTQMIVWGGQGFDSSFLTTGARYDPSTDNWTATNTTNVPDSGIKHTAIWSGTEMIVWGGYNNFGYLNTGGRYCGRPGATSTPTATATPTSTTTATPTSTSTPTPRRAPSPRPRPTPPPRP